MILLVIVATFAASLLALLAYDVYATLSNKAPTISSLVITWGITHKFWLLMFEGVILGGAVALGVHFLWP
jgi:hypothetical protein